MTFPVVQSRGSGERFSDTASHPIILPSGATSGDLILGIFSTDSTATVTISSGWTVLGTALEGSGVRGTLFYRLLNGGAQDAAPTVTTSFADQSTHVTLRISGAADAPTASSATGNSANANPPSHTPAGGAKDYLWVVTQSVDSTAPATGAPAGYSNLTTEPAASSSNASTATSERALNASTEDPGTFTSPLENWVCWTVAVAPASMPPSSPIRLLSQYGSFH